MLTGGPDLSAQRERRGEGGDGQQAGWAAAHEGEWGTRGDDWAEQAERRKGRKKIHFLFQIHFPNAFSN